MKKWFAGVGVFAVAILSSQMGFAQEVHQGFYVEALGAAAIPTDDELDTGAYFGGRLGYRVNGHVALELESGYAQFDNTEDLGEISFVPFLASIRVHPIADKKFDPYLLAGLGVLFTDIEINDEAVLDTFSEEFGTDLSAAGFSISTDADIDDAFAGQVGAGFLYHFSEHVAGFLEIRVILAEADSSGSVTITGPGFTTTEAISDTAEELHTITIGGGLRIEF